ncbi:uncharacterized protein [Hetaerina americana]|uniref:uncharacterized protein n=1 Tax=Hetaerina americana TaxID=62018 RepID=UPI003A7F105D
MASEPANADLNRVSIRVPPFWVEKPSLWFSQLESQFALSGTTQDSTKFYHVVGVLENHYAQEVEDIITNPPSEGKYERLKSELIRRLSTSTEHKLRRLLKHEEIGDRKPSQFLRHLRNLAGSSVNEEFLRSLWLNRLPTNMQAILTAHDGIDLDGLSVLADKIGEVWLRSQVANMAVGVPNMAASAPSTTAAVSNMATSASDDGIDTLMKRVDDLTRLVAALSVNRDTRWSRSRSRSRKQSQSRGSSRNSDGRRDVCWYHRRFGANARKCTTPCSYASENP